jgi:photosystem II stability/assembly factor-like uncharacterized protein
MPESHEPNDDPQGRAAHYEASLQGSHDGSFAALRVKALEAVRPETLAQTVALAVPGAANWVQLGPTVTVREARPSHVDVPLLMTGRVTAFVINPANPAVMYLGAAGGGVWKTVDRGLTWTPKSDNEVSLAIGALALAHSAPDTLYAGTGEGNLFAEVGLQTYQGSGILKSTDGGDTWVRQAAAQLTGQCVFRIAVHPGNASVAFAATSGGLYRTTNGGATWTLLMGGLPSVGPPSDVRAACDVAIDPSTPDTVYAAFWSNSTAPVYRTTNAISPDPTFSAVTGLPAPTSRIALAISPTAPAKVYAAVLSAEQVFQGIYALGADLAFRRIVPAASPSINLQGTYTLDVTVNPTTPDIVYLGGISLYKFAREQATGTWSVTDIGQPPPPSTEVHADHHGLTFHPVDPLRVYASTDGGVYESRDAGSTWFSRINDDLCIAQFQTIAQHPDADAVILGGTQDNGTQQYQGSGAFRQAIGGDGGAMIIDRSDPRNVMAVVSPGGNPFRSQQGGSTGWTDVSTGTVEGGGSALFYPPMVADATNSLNVALGTNRVLIDPEQGARQWPEKVALPGIQRAVSALAYVNSNLIYAATAAGEVFRCVRTDEGWSATAIHGAPLPQRWIWDIVTVPGDDKTVLVGMSGFGTPHVWRGAVRAGDTAATWTDISGSPPDRLPDAPVYSMEVDPSSAGTIYVGTDAGVLRTVDGGMAWKPCNAGLPNVAVYDLKIHGPAGLLRAATHGRGLWERRLDDSPTPAIDLYVRDNVMTTGRILPAPERIPSTVIDLLRGVRLGRPLSWWECADVKRDAPVDPAPSFQFSDVGIDFRTFEMTLLDNDSVVRGRENRVYVQVNNRGLSTADDAVVKVLRADATSALPPLPQDFWSRFPADSMDPGSPWTPIGPAQTAPPVSPTRPTIVEWNWTPQRTAPQHSCLLVIVESPSDPIPPAHRILDVAELVRRERRVGLRNVHLVSAQFDKPVPPAEFALGASSSTDDLRCMLHESSGWQVALVVPPSVGAGLSGGISLDSDSHRIELLAALARTRNAERALGRTLDNELVRHPSAFAIDPVDGTTFHGLPTSGIAQAFIWFRRSAPASRAVPSLSVIQTSRGRIVGGNTFYADPSG